MTLRRFFSATLLVATLFVLAAPASALPPTCDVRCTPTAPGYTLCTDPTTLEVIECCKWIHVCVATSVSGTNERGLPTTVLVQLGIDG